MPWRTAEDSAEGSDGSAEVAIADDFVCVREVVVRTGLRLGPSLRLVCPKLISKGELARATRARLLQLPLASQVNWHSYDHRAHSPASMLRCAVV